MTTVTLHQAALAATNVARRSTTTWLTAYREAVEVGVRYWAGALARGATPLDIASDGRRWLDLVTTRRAPSWSTPNEIRGTSPLTILRDFSLRARPGPRSRVTPALVLPPQAGHHSCIVDFSPDQSQVRTALEAGLTRLFALEWLGATGETKDASIAEYLGEVRSAIERIGEPVHLVGDCQGGWLATIYAALHPGDVASLTIAGAPIDAHAGDSAIADAVRLGGGMAPYRLAVQLGGGLLPGSFMLGGFVALRPESELTTQAELALHLDDEDYVRRHAAFRDWYEHTQAIPGGLYLWAVERLFLRNELARGVLTIDGEHVTLEEIDCPVHLVAGEADHITPPAQVFALGDRVGSAEITRSLVPGGHLGLFMGHHALDAAWRPLFSRLAR